MIKEIFVFSVIFLFLALGMHMNQWLTHPLEHLSHLATDKMPYHPLLYTTIVYLFIGFLRMIVRFILNLFSKN